MSWLEPPLVFSLPFPPPCVSCPVVSSIPMCVCHHSHVLSCLPSVCVRQGTSTVCVLVGTHQHTALLCTILSRLLFLCLSSTTITLNFRPSLSLRETSGGMANTINTPVSSKQRVEKRGAAQTRAGLRPQRHSPHLSLFAHCVVGTLSAASLTQPHKKSLSCKKREEKRDYDTWCSQVVSNPSTNQARRGLTSLIRREVVLSSWYGRYSFSYLRFVDFCQRTSWQRGNHTVSKKRGGDNRAVVSRQGVFV